MDGFCADSDPKIDIFSISILCIPRPVFENVDFTRSRPTYG